MANLRRWSTTATGNATVAGGVSTINFAEGQNPGSVNNSAREMMAQVRSIYTPGEWGWVEHSATASVASQTSFKLAGDQTSNWAAGRRWRLKSGSTTRYGKVVSSSFTTETTITVTVDTGSLSASHSLAAISPIDAIGRQIPNIRQDTNGYVAIGNASLVTQFNVGNGTDQIWLDASGGSSNIYMGKPADTLCASKFTSADAKLTFSVGTAGLYPDYLTFSSAGLFSINPNFLIGYKAGSGGTVTQATSKSTGVTLNGVTGQITTHNANLAAGASVTFVLTNSAISTTEAVIIHRQSGGTNGAYYIWCDAVSAGSCRIGITNISGGPLAEAIAIRFALIGSVNI